MGATRDQRHVLAGGREAGAEQPAHRTGAENANFHRWSRMKSRSFSPFTRVGVTCLAGHLV
jgi:hypothetical protein